MGILRAFCTRMLQAFWTRFAGLQNEGIALRSRALRTHSLREKYFFTGGAGEKMTGFCSVFCGKRKSATLFDSDWLMKGNMRYAFLF